MLISLLLPLRAPAPASRFSPPGDAVAFHFFDRIAVAIVIESICDRVDSNSWTVPRSRQFVDTEHPGGRSQFPDCRPPCKSFVKGEKDSPDARLGGARTIEAIRTRSSHVCLSAVVPAFAEPDIHSLSQVHADRHRRLSVCSLPVLKQFEESLGSLISVAQSATAGPGSLRAV